MKEGFNSALIKCYFCNKDDAILLNMRSTHSRAVEEAHGKIVDMKPCPECAGYMKQGIILMTFDPAKSEPGWHKQRVPNPYRTGGWFVITEDAFRRVFKDDANNGVMACGLKHRWMFIEHEAAEQSGSSKHNQPTRST